MREFDQVFLTNFYKALFITHFKNRHKCGKVDIGFWL